MRLIFGAAAIAILSLPATLKAEIVLFDNLDDGIIHPRYTPLGSASLSE